MIQPEPELPESKPPQVWGPWATIGFSLAIFVVYFVVTFIVAAAFSVIEVLRNPGIDASGLAESLAEQRFANCSGGNFSGNCRTRFHCFFHQTPQRVYHPRISGIKENQLENIFTAYWYNCRSFFNFNSSRPVYSGTSRQPVYLAGLSNIRRSCFTLAGGSHICAAL